MAPLWWTASRVSEASSPEFAYAIASCFSSWEMMILGRFAAGSVIISLMIAMRRSFCCWNLSNFSALLFPCSPRWHTTGIWSKPPEMVTPQPHFVEVDNECTNGTVLWHHCPGPASQNLKREKRGKQHNLQYLICLPICLHTSRHLFVFSQYRLAKMEETANDLRFDTKLAKHLCCSLSKTDFKISLLYFCMFRSIFWLDIYRNRVFEACRYFVRK